MSEMFRTSHDDVFPAEKKTSRSLSVGLFSCFLCVHALKLCLATSVELYSHTTLLRPGLILLHLRPPPQPLDCESTECSSYDWEYSAF